MGRLSKVMDSDDDFQFLEESSPQVVQRTRFKRLKKASKISNDSPTNSSDNVLTFPKVDFAELEALEAFKVVEEFDDSIDEPVSSQGSEGKSISNRKNLDFGGSGEMPASEHSKEAKRSLEFDDDVDQFPRQGEESIGIGNRSLGFDDDENRVCGESEESSGIDKALEFGDGANEIGERIGGIDDSFGSGDAGEKFRGDGGESDGIGIMIQDMNMDMDMEKLGKERNGEGDRNVKEDGKKKKNKKRSKGDVDDQVNPKELASNKRKEEKERKAHLQQLHVDTQRLLRESRDAAFKPIPVVHKPISSVLEKIRKRKLEVSKKTVILNSSSSYYKISSSREVMMEVDSTSAFSEEQRVDKLEIELEGDVVAQGIDTGSYSDASNVDGISVSPIPESSTIAPDVTAVDERPNPVFRAPVDDTQDLFGDSEATGSKDEMLDDLACNPLEEVMAPSLLALNLKFDSAPADECSSDEEDNDKENITPHPLEDVKGGSSPKGDPVKAFLDEEAVEEDDSDNDLFRFGENEEDEDIEDYAELHDMIATEYEEKPIDNEKRNELHQKWLEQQDAAGTDNLMQRLKCDLKQKETTLLDDEPESQDRDEDDSDDIDMDAVPKNAARLNLKKAKQIIAEMFMDKDDAYLSDEDEETEKKLVKQCLLARAEKTAVVSPVKDDSSREIFGLIKKLNIVPDNKRKPKTSSFFDTVLGDQKNKSSLKSSFLGRASNHHLPSSHKQSSNVVRSFIFGRDDSNSRSSISVSEDSLDMISKESHPVRNCTAKFGNSQAKSSSQVKNAGVGTSASAPLFDILKRSSAPSNVCSRDVLLDLPKPLLADLRVSKRSRKLEGKM